MLIPRELFESGGGSGVPFLCDPDITDTILGWRLNAGQRDSFSQSIDASVQSSRAYGAGQSKQPRM